jgi:hypothetical protein
MYDRHIEAGHTIMVPRLNWAPFFAAEKSHTSTGAAKGEIPFVIYRLKPQI